MGAEGTGIRVGGDEGLSAKLKERKSEMIVGVRKKDAALQEMIAEL